MRTVFTKDKDRELFIKRVRDIGEFLIKNAESIVGSEEYIVSINIRANINFDEVPSINISKDILPENSVNAETYNMNENRPYNATLKPSKNDYEGELKPSR